MIATRQLVIGGFEWSADRIQILPIPCTQGTLPWQLFFGFLYMWCTLAPPSMCGGDAALCQITFTPHVLVPSAIIGILVCSVVATVSASSVALLSCRVPSTLFLLLHFFVYVWQINDDDDDDITVSRVSTDAAVITRCVERRNFLTVRRVLYLNNVVKRLRVCCARSPRML